MCNRVLSLRIWNPDEQWPNFAPEVLLKNIDWLTPYLSSVRKANDLKRINLAEILFYSLSPEKQNQLDKLAPQKTQLPNKTNAQINYSENGSAPVLAVPLQRCFGLLDTPAVNNGKTKVLMHLLSPGFKVVQITNDLQSFWENAYFEVRKELRIRYKRHKWPENPKIIGD